LVQRHRAPTDHYSAIATSSTFYTTLPEVSPMFDKEVHAIIEKRRKLTALRRARHSIP
jgi:hypothetical protein